MDVLFFGKKGKVVASFRGLTGFFKMVEVVSKQRRKTQATRVVSDEVIFEACRIPEKQSFWKTVKHI
jgi:hypothetical protein